jgi:very-short-patch-repair endonuclease
MNLHIRYIGKTINGFKIIKTFKKKIGIKNPRYMLYSLSKCICGKESEIRFHDILNKQIKRCRYCTHGNLVGKQFGLLTVLEYTGTLYKNSSNRSINCLCKCGNYFVTTPNRLNSKDAVSCGCWRKKKLDEYRAKCFHNLVGKKFGYLEVINRISNRKGKVRWKVICHACNKYNETCTSDLLYKKIKSCTCLRNNHPPRQVSKTETYFLDKLEEEFNIKIERQYKIKNKYYDGYLEDRNLLIECDSDYWHSSARAKSNDRYKTKLAEENNLNLVRFKINSINNANSVLQSLKDLRHE